MPKYELSMLDSFKNLSSQLKSEPITNAYQKKEEKILRKRMDLSRREARSITMSNQKYQKAFSL